MVRSRLNSGVSLHDAFAPFRLWFYLAKIGGGCFERHRCTFIFLSPAMASLVAFAFIALCLLIPLCLVGAFLGILMSFRSAAHVLPILWQSPGALVVARHMACAVSCDFMRLYPR